MKKNMVFLSLIFILMGNVCLLAQKDSDTTMQNSDEAGLMPEFKNLSELQVGYYGTTQNCEAFNIYAFKYKRTWMFIAKQKESYTFLVVNPPRSDAKGVIPGSAFLHEGLSIANENSYLKLKKRRKVVKDIEIYGFYKFYRPGKKAMKGLFLLEYPDPNLGLPWPLKWLSGKVEEAASSVEGILPEVSVETPEVPKIALPEMAIPE